MKPCNGGQFGNWGVLPADVVKAEDEQGEGAEPGIWEYRDFRRFQASVRRPVFANGLIDESLQFAAGQGDAFGIGAIRGDGKLGTGIGRDLQAVTGPGGDEFLDFAAGKQNLLADQFGNQRDTGEMLSIVDAGANTRLVVVRQ